MAVKITKSVRAELRSIIDESSMYDAATMQITRNGGVTAKKSADKTFNGSDERRYIVGHVEDLLAERRRQG